MAPSIPRPSRKRRAPHRTSTAEYKHGRGRRRRTSKTVSPEPSTVMDSDAPYLPQEIITDILKRLPVKSLIRFQCVCKDWKNLFKTSSFIAEHVRHSTQQDPVFLFKKRDDKCNPEYFCLFNRDMQVLEYQTPPSSVRSFAIIGSSNGLLCLVDKVDKSSFVLWNPATREVHQVPGVPNLDHTKICYVGFGFSPIVNDYKIVRLSISSLDDDRVYLVQVFSGSTRSWKEVEVGKLKGIMPFARTCGFTFDGAIFWFGLGFQERCLISFDMAAELFALIPIPRSANVTYESMLTTYENKLAMLSKTRVEFNIGKLFPHNFPINLWVMEECVDTSGERWIWTKIPTILDQAPLICPLPICRYEIVGATKDKTILVFCDFLNNELKVLAVGKFSIGTVIWNYAESLVSVDDFHIEASSS